MDVTTPKVSKDATESESIKELETKLKEVAASATGSEGDGSDVGKRVSAKFIAEVEVKENGEKQKQGDGAKEAGGKDGGGGGGKKDSKASDAGDGKAVKIVCVFFALFHTNSAVDVALV